MRPGPLFVVGMWRSGTSLLYALLNQHPEIGLMYESDLALLGPLFFIPRKTAWWASKADAWNQALTRHKIDVSAIPENISDLPSAFRAVAEQYAQQKGATIWGCKSPSYYDCMNMLADYYPEARFIVIWRDPADVLRSIIRASRKASWFARPGTHLRALLGYRRMKQEADQLERRGASMYQLHYDELVRDPKSTLTAICDFIGVQFDPRMTSLEGADRSAVYSGEHHSGVKSSAIKAQGQRPEVLSPELKAKIDRYVVYWRRQSNGQWPVHATVPDGVPAASLFERTTDRIRHRAVRLRDEIVPFFYTFVPVSVWQKYRQAKSRRHQSAMKSDTGKPVGSLPTGNI